jgi:hypothetical protein
MWAISRSSTDALASRPATPTLVGVLFGIVLIGTTLADSGHDAELIQLVE